MPNDRAINFFAASLKEASLIHSEWMGLMEYILGSHTGDFMKKVPTATCALRDR